MNDLINVIGLALGVFFCPVENVGIIDNIVGDDPLIKVAKLLHMVMIALIFQCICPCVTSWRSVKDLFTCF